MAGERPERLFLVRVRQEAHVHDDVGVDRKAVIKDGTEFSPAKIAERFFTVSELAADKWRQEYVYSGNA